MESSGLGRQKMLTFHIDNLVVAALHSVLAPLAIDWTLIRLEVLSMRWKTAHRALCNMKTCFPQH